jgi:hypothetical protein
MEKSLKIKNSLKDKFLSKLKNKEFYEKNKKNLIIIFNFLYKK